MKLIVVVQNKLYNIFVGGCVDRGEGSSFRAKAHAHNWTGSKNYGWICVRSFRRCGVVVSAHAPGYDGEIIKPSMLILHEVAHILTPNHGHDDYWRKAVRSIGGRLGKQYIKRKRS